MEDQRSDMQRLLDAIEDLEPTAVARACCANSAARCGAADFDVTAVVVDEELIDVEPGDTTDAPLRDRVRHRHDDRRRDAARPRQRPAAGGRLDAQPPAAVTAPT